jgi:hypothetical protein
MPTTTVEIRSDENGYFSKTVRFDAPGASGMTVRVSATLLSPSATGLWGSVHIDAKDGKPSNETRAFVMWHSEAVQLGSWVLDAEENIIVIRGKTKPTRVHTRLVLEIDSDIS